MLAQKSVEQSYAEPMESQRKTAEQGHVAAQNDLGICYYNGQGVKQSYEDAVKWFRKAAEQGYAEAQRMLGNCYYNGKGAEQSYAEAAKWYCKAAEQRYVDALYDLACCYELVKVYDYDKALYWYAQAAQLGHENASRRLRVLKDEAWYVRSMRKLLAYLGVDPNSFRGAFIGVVIGLNIIVLLLLFLCWLWHVFFE